MNEEVLTLSDEKICLQHGAYHERIGDLERRVGSVENKLWAVILLLVANLAGIVAVLLR